MVWKYWTFVLAVCVLLCRCSPTTEEKSPAPSFVIKEFRVESAEGCKQDTLQCAYYAVSYPEFAGLDSTASSALQRRIDANVSMGNPEADGQTMKQIGEAFIKDFEEFRSEFPDETMGWHYQARVKVEVLTDTLLSLSVDEEYYSGGAHGGYGTYFINVIPRTGEVFTLDNLLKDGYQTALTTLGEKIFRETNRISPAASLNEAGFEFADDNFQLNQNYGFKKEGIAFFYNSYEIAAYAFGPTELLIPYETLGEWIRK